MNSTMIYDFLQHHSTLKMTPINFHKLVY